jgi:Kef-type K+ transport system membrane component KefB
MGNLGICLLATVVAILSKFTGSAFAAKIAGLSSNKSIKIGILLNTKGLMELVVLSIGRDMGIINTQIFTIMVVMTMITTCMTGPLLSLVEKKGKVSSRRGPAVLEKEIQ